MGCKKVEGTFESRVVPPEKGDQPGMLRTEGRVMGGLEGSYKFRMTKAPMQTGEPETQSITFFIGRSVVQTASGELLGVDTGTIDGAPDGGMASLISWTGGSKGMNGASGQIRLRGDLKNGAIFGSYSGTICTP